MSKKREIKIGTVLLLITIILFFIILEVVIRLFFPISDTIWIGDSIIGHKHIPNKSGIFVISEHISKVKFNSEGFRDIDHKIENPNDKYRIAILGDSFVDALEVDFEDSFHQLLQKELNEKYPNKYEIFNFGLYYFSTGQEFLQYQSFVKKYNPDLVVLFVFMNDPYETCLQDDKNPTFYFENNTLKQRPFTPNNYSNIQIFISKYFKSTVFLRKLYYDFKRNLENNQEKQENDGIPSFTKVFLKNYDNQVEECWNLTSYFLRELNQQIKQDKSNLLIFIIPNPVSIYEEDKNKFLSQTNLNESSFDFFKPDIIFEQILEKDNISYVNLRWAIQKQKERVYYTEDGHFNIQGHKFVKDKLLETFKNQKFII